MFFLTMKTQLARLSFCLVKNVFTLENIFNFLIHILYFFLAFSFENFFFLNLIFFLFIFKCHPTSIFSKGHLKILLRFIFCIRMNNFLLIKLDFALFCFKWLELAFCDLILFLFFFVFFTERGR